MWRYVKDEGQSLHKIVDIPPVLRVLLRFGVFRRRACKLIRTNAWCQGIGRLKEEDVLHIMGDDLRALSTILGNKKFILGEDASEVDCAVFGMLVQALWCSPGSPYERMLHGKFILYLNVSKLC